MAPQSVIFNFQMFERDVLTAMDGIRGTLMGETWTVEEARNMIMNQVNASYAQFEEYVRNYKEVTEDDTN